MYSRESKLLKLGVAPEAIPTLIGAGATLPADIKKLDHEALQKMGITVEQLGDKLGPKVERGIAARDKEARELKEVREKALKLDVPPVSPAIKRSKKAGA